MSDKKFDFPSAATFASSIGQAVWLMSVSKNHRHIAVGELEAAVTPAIVLQQFKIYLKGKQPIAFLAWASVSDEVKERFEQGGYVLNPNDWRSGSNIIVVECVSPFAERAQIEQQFFDSIKPSAAQI
jgi:hemolysin-activating ACP:hemolysin acyltransferase